MHLDKISLSVDHRSIGTYQVCSPPWFSRSFVFQTVFHFNPGFSMDFGRILVRDPPQHIELAKPFSPDLARQWGLDVMCLPYNVLPFDILDRARTLSYSDAVISENMRFNPQTVKINLVRSHSPRLILHSQISTGCCLSCAFPSVSRTVYLTRTLASCDDNNGGSQ